MARFRRKSDGVLVNASRFHPGNGTPAGVIEHKSGLAFVGPDRVYPGDWVVVNEKGLLEVFNSEVFAAKYDPVVTS